MFSYEDFIIQDEFSTEKLNNQENNISPIKEDEPKNISDRDYMKMLYSFETMYKDSLKIKKAKSKLFSLEAEDDDPFADLGDGLDDGDSGLVDGGGGSDDVSFDSFDDSSDSIFGDDFGSDLSGEDGGEAKGKALQVSRSDLLDESHNLGMYVRRVIPKKIKSLIDIIDYNIEVINKDIEENGNNFEDFLMLKESYQEVKNFIKEYLDIIDSKTFEDIFSDYVVFLSLIDKVNDMYKNLIKHIEKQ